MQCGPAVPRFFHWQEQPRFFHRQEQQNFFRLRSFPTNSSRVGNVLVDPCNLHVSNLSQHSFKTLNTTANLQSGTESKMYELSTSPLVECRSDFCSHLQHPSNVGFITCIPNSNVYLWPRVAKIQHHATDSSSNSRIETLIATFATVEDVQSPWNSTGGTC